MDFDIVGEIRNAHAIAVGRGIRELARLKKEFGRGRWRKMKGEATVRLGNGIILEAEVHWYEAHGKGKVLLKIKHFLSD